MWISLLSSGSGSKAISATSSTHVVIRRCFSIQPTVQITTTPRSASRQQSQVAVVGRYLCSYSRMLDLGGAPSSLNSNDPKRRVDVSKNCQIQAICFEFDVLTKSLVDDTAAANTSTSSTTSTSDSTVPILGKVAPDQSRIEDITNLLQKRNNNNQQSRQSSSNEEDDLSLLVSVDDNNSNTKSSSTSINETKNKKGNASSFGGSDIGYKYADKLSKKGIVGGIYGVQLAKQQAEETLQKGDAAGHIAARNQLIASTQAHGGQNQHQRWMASTGTGSLLKFISHRSMKILLLPTLSNTINEEEGARMDDFRKQLSHDIQFEMIQKDGTIGVTDIMNNCFQQLKDMNPNRILLVSDKDAYIRTGKELGLVTVRIRPPNTPRGNVSAHYIVDTIPETQEIINQINGISFNPALH
jgi:hypothetical protein